MVISGAAADDSVPGLIDGSLGVTVHAAQTTSKTGARINTFFISNQSLIESMARHPSLTLYINTASNYPLIKALLYFGYTITALVIIPMNWILTHYSVNSPIKQFDCVFDGSS